ncbi:unnamed protein product [Amoebophrya sp. A25]|nr:unnamed protein product [Amoebophrya sp. A25]|eukprot:GSA25T00025504001.1
MRRTAKKISSATSSKNTSSTAASSGRNASTYSTGLSSSKKSSTSCTASTQKGAGGSVKCDDAHKNWENEIDTCFMEDDAALDLLKRRHNITAKTNGTAKSSSASMKNVPATSHKVSQNKKAPSTSSTTKSSASTSIGTTSMKTKAAATSIAPAASKITTTTKSSASASLGKSAKRPAAGHQLEDDTKQRKKSSTMKKGEAIPSKMKNTSRKVKLKLNEDEDLLEDDLLGDD